MSRILIPLHLQGVESLYLYIYKVQNPFTSRIHIPSHLLDVEHNLNFYKVCGTFYLPWICSLSEESFCSKVSTFNVSINHLIVHNSWNSFLHLLCNFKCIPSQTIKLYIFKQPVEYSPAAATQLICLSNIPMIKKTFKIVAFGENCRHFDITFTSLKTLKLDLIQPQPWQTHNWV